MISCWNRCLNECRCLLLLVLLALQVDRGDAQVESAPTIATLVAASRTEEPIDSVFADLDSITITFNVDTNRAGHALGTLIRKSDINALFSFSQGIGLDYRGEWLSNRVFRITIFDWPSAFPPVVGTGGLRLTCRSDAGV